MFAKLAPRLHDNGYKPLVLRGKVPLTRGWQKGLSWDSIQQLAKKYPDANVGVLTGDLLAIDIDAEPRDVNGELVRLAFDHLGPTDFIRIGREPRRALLYRAEKACHKQSIPGLEILGLGQQLAVFGQHPDTDRPYHWPLDSILDASIDNLPMASVDAVQILLREADLVAEPNRHTLSSSNNTQSTLRNTSLFDQVRVAALTITFRAELADFAHTSNAKFTPPLPENEVEKIVGSVWKYKKQGQLFKAGQQAIVLPYGKDMAIELAHHPHASALYQVLRATRHHQSFTIPQIATARSVGASPNTVKRAILTLINLDLLRQVGLKRTGRGPRPAILYEFSTR